MSDMSAKRWNERLRLVITHFNITSVGAFGLAVTAPILEARRSGEAGLGVMFDELTLSADLSVADVVAWDVATAALALHVFAHILVGLTEPED
ncbi:MAG: hypothetical protein AAF416_02570 [Pseudomonadota bacterium]